MAQAHPSSSAVPGDRFPRVPAFAWSWLQRSRPVVAEAALRLTGKPAHSGFVDHLREQFEADPFTRDVLVAVIADVAFGGRIPRRRPAGASWDRGLIWWAAAIAGCSVEEFEAASQPVVQSRLFGEDERPSPPRRRAASTEPITRSAPPAASERAMLIALLRDVLETAEDGRVPVAAIEHLLAQLQGHSADPPSRQ